MVKIMVKIKRIFVLVLSLFTFILLSSCSEKEQEITKKQACDLLDDYYAALRADDYEAYCKCFPQFYVDAMNEEIEEYNNDFWAKIQDSFIELYGEEFEIDYEFVKMERISDDGIEDAKRSMASAFRIGKPNLTAAYLVTYDETVNGNQSENKYEDLTIVVVKIDGTVYLYDTIYELDESDFAS